MGASLIKKISAGDLRPPAQHPKEWLVMWRLPLRPVLTTKLQRTIELTALTCAATCLEFMNF